MSHLCASIIYTTEVKYVVRVLVESRFDCNGHVSIMAVVRFGGETAIWGTYDDGAQSSELSDT